MHREKGGEACTQVQVGGRVGVKTGIFEHTGPGKWTGGHGEGQARLGRRGEVRPRVQRMDRCARGETRWGETRWGGTRGKGDSVDGAQKMDGRCRKRTGGTLRDEREVRTETAHVPRKVIVYLADFCYLCSGKTLKTWHS